MFQLPFVSRKKYEMLERNYVLQGNTLARFIELNAEKDKKEVTQDKWVFALEKPKKKRNVPLSSKPKKIKKVKKK